MVAILFAALTSCIAWGLVSLFLFSIREVPRVILTAMSYASSVVVFFIAFAVYFKYAPETLSPYGALVAGMLTYFLLETIFWGFFYTGTENYLTFVDWIVPVFLTASVIYCAGVWVA